MVGEALTAEQDSLTEFAPTAEISARLGPIGVNRAEHRRRVEGHTRAIMTLIHAGDSGVLHDEALRNVVAGSELHHEMTAAAATGARRRIKWRNDVDYHRGAARRWRARFLPGCAGVGPQTGSVPAVIVAIVAMIVSAVILAVVAVVVLSAVLVILPPVARISFHHFGMMALG